MPGIQSTFLAMDTEEGVEVVWNELLFTDKKAFKAHEVSGSFLLPSLLGAQLAGKAHPPLTSSLKPQTRNSLLASRSGSFCLYVLLETLLLSFPLETAPL